MMSTIDQLTTDSWVGLFPSITINHSHYLKIELEFRYDRGGSYEKLMTRGPY